MLVPTLDDLELLYRAEVMDRDGHRLGGVAHVYLDDDTGRPSWVTARTGWFGARETFVPLEEASLENGIIQIPYEEDFIKDAPTIHADERLDEDQQDRLYRYYAMATEDDDPLLHDRVVQAHDGRYHDVPEEDEVVPEGVAAEREQPGLPGERARSPRVRLRRHARGSAHRPDLD